MVKREEIRMVSLVDCEGVTSEVAIELRALNEDSDVLVLREVYPIEDVD